MKSELGEKNDLKSYYFNFLISEKLEKEEAERKKLRSRIAELEVQQERNKTEMEKLKSQLGNNENWLSNRC